MMRYMLLMCGEVETTESEATAATAPAQAPAPELAVGEADEPCWMPWAREMEARGVILHRWRAACSRSVRPRRSGPTATRSWSLTGRSPRPRNMILGYDVIECADLDEAIFAASRHPVAQQRRRRRGAADPGLLRLLMTDVEAAVAEAFRQEWGRVVATLIRMTGDWDLAEECAQDAFATALTRWATDGVPDRPGAWLTTTARNRALDRLRRSKTEAAKLQEVAALSVPGGAARLR